MISSSLVHTYFASLGLQPEVTEIYIALHRLGPQTISQLARSSGVERTRIYRLADELAASGLIVAETRYKRVVYKAAPISNLQLIIAKKEQELKTLQANAPKISAMFAHHFADSPATKVQFYSGTDGAKQVFWNETKANTEVLGILFENMQSKTGSGFFERWVRRCNERGIRNRAIIGKAFVASQQKWYNGHQNERLKLWEARYIDETILHIAHSTVVYDNVTAHYNWQDVEVFGLEIYSKVIADTQRSYFEILWKLAQPIDDLVGPRS